MFINYGDSMHKWWHFLFVNISSRHIRETSYDGSLLFREYSCLTKKCSVCKLVRLEIEDFKDSKEVLIDFDKFEIVNKQRVDMGYPHN
jgi:hypothetical protein